MTPILALLLAAASLTSANTPAQIWPLNSGSGTKCYTESVSPNRVYMFDSPFSFTTSHAAKCMRSYHVSASAAVKLECKHFLLPSAQNCANSPSFLSVTTSHNGHATRFCHEELNNYVKTFVFPSQGSDYELKIDIEINQDPNYYWLECQLEAYVDVQCGRTRATVDPRSLPQRRSLPLKGAKRSGLRAISRIVHGQIANANSLPWQAGLISNNLIFCGGVVIANQWILTAAHCLNDVPSDLRVVLGEHDVNNDYDSATYHTIQAIFRHPSYNKDSLNQEFDFALLLLNDYVLFSNTVVPICLPQNYNNNGYGGRTAFVSGWGETESGNLAQKLRLAELEVYANSACQQRYYGFNGNTMMCARGVHTLADACSGDSGGPLTSLDNWGAYQLIGVVSSGELCGHPDYPGGVYGRVDAVLDWIRTATNGARLFYSDN